MHFYWRQNFTSLTKINICKVSRVSWSQVPCRCRPMTQTAVARWGSVNFAFVFFTHTNYCYDTISTQAHAHTLIYIYVCVASPLDAKWILFSEAQTRPTALVSIRQLTASAVRLGHTSWPASRLAMASAPYFRRNLSELWRFVLVFQTCLFSVCQVVMAALSRQRPAFLWKFKSEGRRCAILHLNKFPLRKFNFRLPRVLKRQT